MQTSYLSIAIVLMIAAASACAGELPDIAAVQIEGLERTAVGVTRRGTPIVALAGAEDFRYDSRKTHLLLIGGLDGERRSVDAVLAALQWFHTHDDAAAHREFIHVSAISCANPDGLLLDKGEENGAGGTPGVGYPPPGKFFQSETNVEAQYLQRWLEYHAPEFVIDVRVKEPAAAKDRLPAKVVVLKEGQTGAELMQQQLSQRGIVTSLAPGPQRKSLSQRAQMPPETVIEALLIKYGKESNGKLYYDTLPSFVAVRALYEGPTALPSLPTEAPKSGSEISGLLYLLPRQSFPTDHRDELAALRRAADLAFDKDGKPLAEPPFHNQMSDAVFMNGPLLAGVGELTKEKKYFDACAQQQAFLRKLCRRDDGLYRHSPLCEEAWGRGNGFVALGHALMLENWPQDHPARKELLAAYQEHMAALVKHQGPDGMFHQVIDRPESYCEFSCTCMIGFAMARGIRAGWLERKEYQPHVDRAWQAALVRCRVEQRSINRQPQSAPTGEFVDVCTGTGKQKTLRDYYDREALTGRDGRGASMLLLFASERRHTEK